MGPLHEALLESRMYPDERRVEDTFIELTVIVEFHRMITIDVSHKRNLNTTRKPLIQHRWAERNDKT